jgi:hypothetical protein
MSRIRRCVDERETPAIDLALGFRDGARSQGEAPELAGPRIHADRRQSRGAACAVDPGWHEEAVVRPEQTPAVGDRQHCLPFFPHAAQVLDEIAQRVERPRFTAAVDQFLPEAPRAETARRIADLKTFVLGIALVDPIAFTPTLREYRLDASGFRGEGQITG